MKKTLFILMTMGFVSFAYAHDNDKKNGYRNNWYPPCCKWLAQQYEESEKNRNFNKKQ